MHGLYGKTEIRSWSIVYEKNYEAESSQLWLSFLGIFLGLSLDLVQSTSLLLKVKNI